MNSGSPLGLGWLQSTIGGGKRSTSATPYLAPNFIQRANLDVLVHGQVSRLVNSSTVDRNITFGGPQFTAKAFEEIILSAGTIGTPNILMHPGVGDANILSALGISVVLDLPSVGQNASD
ncbi:glucose-methanol-choline oxidoreductase [Mycena maculata]|uniref:Glucose-methanol-choline oxidoreductase n=1 Tax=Mycena maculata TaxID=230809 RepID=A0AAD7N8P6_9AGAR|nr:glucose-methanol-choline oxidoreductase [Mycena maculata]